MATNQVGSPSVCLNNINSSKTSGEKNVAAIARKTSNRRNIIVVETNIRNERARKSKRDVYFAVKNKKAEKPKRDVKVGLEV